MDVDDVIRWRLRTARIQDCLAARLLRGECIHARIQALDRKDAEPVANGRRLLANATQLKADRLTASARGGTLVA